MRLKKQIMTAVVLILICLAADASVIDNSTKVTLYLYEIPLSKVLEELQKQTGYIFSFSPEMINVSQPVSVNVTNEALTEVVNRLLPAGTQYKVRGKHIILYRKPAPKEEKTVPIAPLSEILKPENRTVTESVEEISSPNSGTVVSIRHSGVNFNRTTEMKLNAELLKSHSVAETVAVSETKTAGRFYSVKHFGNQTKTFLASLLTGMALFTPADTLAQNTATGSSDTVQVKAPLISMSGETKSMQVSYVYPLSTNGVKTATHTYHFSLNVLGGVTGAVEGIELASLFNINSFGSKGFQAAGLFNVSGVPGAEIMESSNTQFAGLFNTTRKGFSAMQAAGIFNLADSSAFQAAGIANMTNSSRIQAAHIANVAKKANCQIAGVANAAKKTDTQIAGIVSIVIDASCQISGVVNVAEKAGFQLGLINVADSANVQIGLINVARNGMMEVEVAYDSFRGITASFRSGKKYFYSIVSIGKSLQSDFYSSGAGLGTSFMLGSRVGLGLEAMSSNINWYNRREMWTSGTLVQAKPFVAIQLGKFAFFGGPDFNMSVFTSSDSRSLLPSRLLYDDDRTVNGWIGWSAGVRYSIF